VANENSKDYFKKVRHIENLITKEGIIIKYVKSCKLLFINLKNTSKMIYVMYYFNIGVLPSKSKSINDW